MQTAHGRIVAMALGFALAVAGPALAAEKVFRGELADQDPLHAEREAPVDRYEVDVDAGSLLTVVYKSNEDAKYDEYLIVSGPMGEEFTNDDDSEVGGSRVMAIAPSSGIWDIEVTAYGRDTRGPYEVRVTVEKLERVISERGELAADDERLPKHGEFFDTYTHELEAGAKYIVLASSTEFNPFLSVHHPGGLVTSDRNPLTTYERAQVMLPAPSAGLAKILVTSGSAFERGRYRFYVYKVVAEKAE